MKEIIYALIGGGVLGAVAKILYTLLGNEKAKRKKAETETDYEKVKSKHLENREKSDSKYDNMTHEEIRKEWDKK